jgi:hypothetical protein
VTQYGHEKYETHVGALRVWYIINVPGTPEHIPVDTPEEAIKVINDEAERQLRNPDIHSNVFGLEVYEEDSDGDGNPGWCEWYNEDGEDIDSYAERLAEESQQ